MTFIGVASNGFLVAFILGVTGLLLGLIWQWRQQLQQQQRQLIRYVFNAQGRWQSASETPSILVKVGMLYPITDKETKRLTQMLEHGGIYSHGALARLCASKLLMGIGAMLVAFFWQLSQPQPLGYLTLTYVLVGYVLGSNLPEYILRHLGKKAKAQQQQVVPDAIDLMVISIEAGLSLERATEKVGFYLNSVEPRLAAQFLRTHSEMKMVGDHAQCIKKLAWRTGLTELSRLGNTLAMAQKYGAPLAETMRSISSDARQMRKMSLEEQAGRLPGRITLIQMLFIMLPLLVLIIAPTMNLLLDSLS
ncbi:type II secretion system F family protein [Motilimonas cestriensis]|uniref:Type II secretion system F family protein n=1 Tax=Motilimonas cestriensis TaxID=2742685 RepID=A0ABS8WGM1_9GAMM|nr:type II secretion system F family protein [Motilimonas cestriensis]MCE2596749.1 type II secretion system F family protein [Motilimonas cestriensis]